MLIETALVRTVRSLLRIPDRRTGVKTNPPMPIPQSPPPPGPVVRQAF
jgi:hypothetical protein